MPHPNAKVVQLVTEREALKDNIDRLMLFRGTPSFMALDETDRYLVSKQLNGMKEYLSALENRIDRLPRN